MRGRGGRGGFVNGAPSHADQAGNGAAPLQELPPVDRTWTHDGFEEMKQKDTGRREEYRLQQRPWSLPSFIMQGAPIPNFSPQKPVEDFALVVPLTEAAGGLNAQGTENESHYAIPFQAIEWSDDRLYYPKTVSCIHHNPPATI